MANDRKTQTALTLTFLMLLGSTMPGCETSGDFVALDSSSTRGWLAIESGVEGFESAWLLVAPDGTEVYGSGDSLLTDPQPGEYWILWEPVEEWNSPAENPDNRTIAEGSTETFIGSYARIQGGMGDIVIDPDPKELRARWNLHGPDGFFAAGKGGRNLKRRGIGEYTVVWGSVDGYTTPPQAKATLQASATLELRTNYTPVVEPVGMIRVDPNPDALEAPWQLESDAGGVFSGNGDSVLVDLTVATYTITWGAVDGFVTPAASVASLDSAATLHLGTAYVAVDEPVGTVLIDPNPDSIQAPWQLESDTGLTYSGSGDSALVDVPMGIYTLTWGEVEGFETPSPNPVSQLLEPGASVVFAIH